VHHVRQVTIGFLLLVTIFGGVWSLRDSSDSVYSISRSAPDAQLNKDVAAGDQKPGSTGDTEQQGDPTTPGGSPSVSPSPSSPPSPSASPKPAPKPVPAKPRPKRTSPITQPKPPAAKPATGDEATKARVVELVNAERAKAGCGAVHSDSRLAAAAQGHSEDMAARDYFDHTTPDGVDPWERAKAEGYMTPTGENIAMGQRTAEDVTEGWMNSPGHRANILNCDSKAIGMGLARNSGGTTYWTQMFGSV
jgi:uncharacterized protein YkwD